MSLEAIEHQTSSPETSPAAEARGIAADRMVWSLVAAAIVAGILLSLVLLVVAWKMGVPPAG
jgi:hypothetical protein